MKTIFKNKRFFYLLISFIALLILWNFYVLIQAKNYWAFLPISIEAILLALILTYNQYARIAILVWTAIFIIMSPALSALGSILGIYDNGSTEINTYSFAFNLGSIIAGIFIVDYTRRTVIVQRGISESLSSEIIEH